MDQHHDFATWVASLISTSAIVASIAGYIPAAGAFVAMTWYCIKIYESRTVQEIIARRRLRKLARLKARVLMLEAQMKEPIPQLPPTFDEI